MIESSLTILVDQLREATRPRSADVSDGDLLAEFISATDQKAFEMLVRRHGPMVLGVCRRVLGNLHDAEDAFQASFLVLARKAPSIRKRDSLSCWLHGVAYRIALRLKRDLARRRLREGSAPSARRNAADDLAWREMRVVLDEEVENLPPVYRATFILCSMEGLTQGETARRLGIKEGTVSSRLAAARKRLRHALSRRGITLSVMAITPNTMSPPVAQASIASASRLLHGSGMSPQVITLAGKAMGTMYTSKIALTALIVLTIGLFGASQHFFGQPPAKHHKKEPVNSPGKQQSIHELAGVVHDPEGKPTSGATVVLWSANKQQMQTTTDDNGRFVLRPGGEPIPANAVVIAKKKGLGPDWVRISGQGKRGQFNLRLVEDDVPIVARVLDLEGNPIAGVEVDVQRVGKALDALTGWLDRNVEMRQRGRYLNEDGLSVLPAESLGLKMTVKTNEKGEVQLKGFGKDRVVRLVVRGDAVEHARMWAVTRPGPARGWITGSFPVYAARFDHLAAPCKPIVGVVLDKKTRKPIPGAIVGGGPSMHLQTKSDEKGRFRLVGIAKHQQGYWISAGGGPGAPYFDRTTHDIPDTPGLEPIEFTVELERGIEITGKVLNKATGKPVEGEVRYFYPQDNPHLKEYTTLGGATLVLSDWGRIEPDGSFRTLGLPGPGVLVVCAKDHMGFPILDTHEKLRNLKVRSFPVDPVHLVVPIEVSETNPASTRHDLTMTPSIERTGVVLDSAGKPLLGAEVLGLSVEGGPQVLKNEHFSVRGLSAGHKFLLLIQHREKRLARALAVEGDKTEPLRVKLEAHGAVKGTMLDEEGRPIAEKTIVALLQVKRHEYTNLPSGILTVSNFSSIDNEPWHQHTHREAKTDKQGQFVINDMIPGCTYTLYVSEGSFSRSNLTPAKGKVEALIEPGKTADLGEMRINLRR